MTIEEVQELVRKQSQADSTGVTNHRFALHQMLIKPQKILLLARSVRAGVTKENTLGAWLVGRKIKADGHSIVMSDDGSMFGLASMGFPEDEHLILVGWYGSLVAAFLAM